MLTAIFTATTPVAIWLLITLGIFAVIGLLTTLCMLATFAVAPMLPSRRDIGKWIDPKHTSVD